VSRQNFPLPVLGAKLDQMSQDVHSGRGFAVIRGIEPSHFAVEDVTLVYLGIQSYIADLRGRQDSKGNMLGEWTPRSLLNWSRPHMLTRRGALVHIVADSSSERVRDHHRHSTKSIVS
jgi:hypothetical protein